MVPRTVAPGCVTNASTYVRTTPPWCRLQHPINSSSIFRGEHRAVSTSSGSITAVLYAATLPVPTIWGHVDELSAGWWRVAHRVVLVAPVPVAPRRVGFDIGGVPEVRYKWRSEARDLSRSIWFASPLSWAIVKESDNEVGYPFPRVSANPG